MTVNRTIWILGGVFVLLVIVLFFVFTSGDDPSGDTTLAATDLTTTTIDTDPSTTEGVTTTSAPVPTTTGPVETTTTMGTTTTTDPVTGNWAAEPIVVAGFGALGWWDGTGWVNAGDALPVVGGEDYQVAVLGLTAITSGSGQQFVCEPLDNVGVVLADEGLLGEYPGPYGVAISAPWIITPHIVEPIADDGTYSAIAAELLAERGLVVDDPVIVQLLRVDLEGDGINEILVVAEEIAGGMLPTTGDYSILFLRKVVAGDVETAVIADAIVLDPGIDFTASFRVGSVADMSGDAKMEIVVSSAYFEGLGVEVFEWVNDDLGPVSQITSGCGS